jgi:hypothetical protein
MMTEKLVECTAEEYQQLEEALKLIAKDGEIKHGTDVGRTHGMGNIIFMNGIVADWRWTFEGKNVRKWTYRWSERQVDNLRKCRARDVEIQEGVKKQLQAIADGPEQPQPASVVPALPPLNVGEWVPPFGQFASHRLGGTNQPSRRHLSELTAPQYGSHTHKLTIDDKPKRLPIVSSRDSSALSGVEARLTQQERGKAEAWEKLTALLGYVENGTSEVVTVHQDDATRSYIVKVGPVGMSHTSARKYYDGDTLAKAVDAAFMGEVAGRG